MANAFEFIPGRYGYTVERTGPVAAAGRIPLEPTLADGDGNLRTAAVLMGIDMTCGMAGGLGVLPNWTVTADAFVHFVGACRIGPLRVDAVNVRAGRSMSVVEARAVDEGADDELVAIATANHGVLESTFEHRVATAGAGVIQRFARPDRPADESIETYFGLEFDGDGVAIGLERRTTNPWGIFHGGLHGLLVDTCARRAGLGTFSQVDLRFLNAVKEGPAVARTTDSVAAGDDRIVRVEVRDGASGRLAVIGHVTGR
jgi:acyl-coenzyme A thioesterase PaaI-like protein